MGRNSQGFKYLKKKFWIVQSKLTMKSNRLILNPSKTDFLWCATHRRCNQLSTVPLEVCVVRVPPTDTVRDLGILLEADMQMTDHVRQPGDGEIISRTNFLNEFF